MSSLTYIEKEMIAEFFGFDRGYIFSFWTKQNKKWKCRWS